MAGANWRVNVAFITTLVSAMWFVDTVAGGCKLHNAEWLKKGPIIRQPSLRVPTSVIVDWKDQIKNQRCADGYNIYVWKTGKETIRQARKYSVPSPITLKTNSFNLTNIEACVNLSYVVEIQQNSVWLDKVYTKRSRDITFATEGAAIVVDKSPLNFHVGYFFNTDHNTHDLRRAIIKFNMDDVMKYPNCAKKIVVSGTNERMHHGPGFVSRSTDGGSGGSYPEKSQDEHGRINAGELRTIRPEYHGRRGKREVCSSGVNCHSRRSTYYASFRSGYEVGNNRGYGGSGGSYNTEEAGSIGGYESVNSGITGVSGGINSNSIGGSGGTAAGGHGGTNSGYQEDAIGGSGGSHGTPGVPDEYNRGSIGGPGGTNTGPDHREDAIGGPGGSHGTPGVPDEHNRGSIGGPGGTNTGPEHREDAIGGSGGSHGTPGVPDEYNRGSTGGHGGTNSGSGYWDSTGNENTGFGGIVRSKREAIKKPSYNTVTAETSPPFGSSHIEISIKVKPCTPYNFTLTIYGRQSSALGTIHNLLLPPLKEQKNLEVPKLSNIIKVSKKSDETVTIMLNPDTNIPATCLSSYISAIDSQIDRMETDFHRILTHKYSVGSPSNESGLQIGKDLAKLHANIAKLKNAGCRCYMTTQLNFTTNSSSALYKYPSSFGKYVFEGKSHDGKPYYVHKTQRKNENRYMFWKAKENTWWIANTLEADKAWFYMDNEGHNLPSCPGDNDFLQNKPVKWYFSRTFQWEEVNNLHIRCLGNF